MISPATAAALTRSWQHGPVAVIGTPVVSAGVAYLADAFGVVHAVNAATGARLWATDVSDALDPFLFTSLQSAPVVTRDALFVGDTDAVLYRLNRRTGAVEWATQVDRNPNALIQGDPIVCGDQAAFRFEIRPVLGGTAFSVFAIDVMTFDADARITSQRAFVDLTKLAPAE